MLYICIETSGDRMSSCVDVESANRAADVGPAVPSVGCPSAVKFLLAVVVQCL